MTRVVATLILPLADNDNTDLTPVHNVLKRELCERFGGFTAVPVYGGWIDNGKYYEDRSFEYRVAVEPTGDNDELWYDLAFRYGKLAGQLAVYLTSPFNPELPQILDLNGIEASPYSSEGLTSVIDGIVAANDNEKRYVAQ